MSFSKQALPGSAQRALAVAVAGALLPLGFAAAAFAAPPGPVPTNDACPTDQVPLAGFTDIAGVEAVNRNSINCIADYGIALGTTATTYSPGNSVTREQMALFLTRLATYANLELDATPVGFTDISSLPQASRDAINALGNAEVANGITATTYAPFSPVTRGQMAAFINRLQGVVDAPFAPGDEDFFTDDEELPGDFEVSINGLAAAGIAAGNTPTTFNPNANVTRAQMASFLARHIEVNVDLGFIDSLYAGAGLETVAVAPATAVTLPLAQGEEDGEVDGDDRLYTVTGLSDALRYRITLVNGTSIQGEAGDRTFLSSEIVLPAPTTPATYGVDVGADNADITAVNGATPLNNGVVLDAAARTATGVPVNGSITFSIDGTGPGTVVPAVYVDGGQGGTETTGGASVRLETAATTAGEFAAATETFGLGGATTFTAPEGANGTITGPVTTVDKAANSLSTGGTGTGNVRYDYDANDTYSVDGVSVGIDAFEAALSSSDGLAGTYTQDATGISNFALTDGNPATPAAPIVVVGMGADSNDISVTATIVGDADTVAVQRATVTATGNSGSVGEFATISTETGADDVATTPGTQVVYLDNNVAAGTYVYRVIVTNDGDVSTAGAESVPVTSVTPGPDVAGPTLEDSRVSSNNGLATVADAGDVFTLSFSEALGNPTAGDILRLTDGDGTVVDVINGTNASFAVNTAALPFLNGAPRAAGTVLTVTLTSTPAALTAGTAAGLNYQSTIVDSSGVDDVAGNRPATGGDRTLEVAANVTTAPTTEPDLPGPGTGGPIPTNPTPQV